MIRYALAGVLLCGLAMVDAAVAVPPPAGTPDAEQLGQFSQEERAWISKQHDQAGRRCCDEGDFAFVTIRDRDGQLEAKANHPDADRGIPEGWLPVPAERHVDLRGQKNTPDVLAAWYYRGKIQCIILGSGY